MCFESPTRIYGSMFLERLSHDAGAANAQLCMAVLPFEHAHRIHTERRQRCNASGGGHTRGDGQGVHWQNNTKNSHKVGVLVTS